MLCPCRFHPMQDFSPEAIGIGTEAELSFDPWKPLLPKANLQAE